MVVHACIIVPVPRPLPPRAVPYPVGLDAACRGFEGTSMPPLVRSCRLLLLYLALGLREAVSSDVMLIRSLDLKSDSTQCTANANHAKNKIADIIVPFKLEMLRSWRCGMAPAQISVFLSQKPGTTNGQFCVAVVRLAW